MYPSFFQGEKPLQLNMDKTCPKYLEKFEKVINWAHNVQENGLVNGPGIVDVHLGGLCYIRRVFLESKNDALVCNQRIVLL